MAVRSHSSIHFFELGSILNGSNFIDFISCNCICYHLEKLFVDVFTFCFFKYLIRHIFVNPGGAPTVGSDEGRVSGVSRPCSGPFIQQ